MQDQEEREFWEWCGFKLCPNPKSSSYTYIDAEKIYRGVLRIDLNNLFRYAVPKLYLELCRKGQYHKMKAIYEALEQEIIKGSTESEINPAQALYKAIQEGRKSCSH